MGTQPIEDQRRVERVQQLENARTVAFRNPGDDFGAWGREKSREAKRGGREAGRRRGEGEKPGSEEGEENRSARVLAFPEDKAQDSRLEGRSGSLLRLF